MVAGFGIKLDHLGAKSWVFRLSFEKRDHKMGLDSINTISLSEAREEAPHFRKLLRKKINLLIQRQQTIVQNKMERENRKTFAQCVSQYIEDNRVSWKNAKHAKQ